MNLQEVVDAYLRKTVPAEMIRLIRIKQAWPKVAPDWVVANAFPASVRGRRLVLHVQDNQWLHELTYWRQELLEKLQEHCPDARVEAIDAYVGVVGSEEAEPPPPRLQRRRPGVQLPQDVPSETLSALNAIDDPDLRDACAAARMMLGNPGRWMSNDRED